MNFTKMHGIGNDFIIIDDIDNKYLGNEGDMAKKLCHRHFSIGADGVIFVRKSEIADIKMLIINSDGSYAAMCGNGLRCFTKYVYDRSIVKKQFINVETGDGIKKVKINDYHGKADTIEVNMGRGSFMPYDIPAKSDEPIINKTISENNKIYSIISLRMGVPHTVILGNLENFDIHEGMKIENNELFLEGTNVDFCEIESKTSIKVKTWERGVGPTLACGTGCCASFLAAHKVGLIDNEVIVHVDGGKLNIKLIDDDVYMIGESVEAFTGSICINEK